MSLADGAAPSLPYGMPYRQIMGGGVSTGATITSPYFVLGQAGSSASDYGADGSRSNREPSPSPSPSPPPPRPPPPQPDSSADGTAGASLSSSRQGSRGAAASQAADDDNRRAGLRQWLRRWLCNWTCLGASSTGGNGSSSKRRAGPQTQLSGTAQPQTAGRSSAGSMVAPSRRSNPSAAAQLRPSGTGMAGGGNSSGGSSNSHVGPLPSRQLHFLQGSQDCAAAATAAAVGAPEPAGTFAQCGAPGPSVAAPPPRSLSNPSSSGGAATGPLAAAGAASGGTGGGALTPNNAAAGSRASSIASYASGLTSTSRPSRWGLLAGILSAGLRSFSQLAGVLEPETGSLSLEAVHDLTRRASRLDVVRAAGQVFDLRLVGSGSVGLVYRGRMASASAATGGGAAAAAGCATVCVKYLIASSADGMAAPATEGLLSRALAHPNIIRTYSWHVTRLTSDNFLELPEALAAMAAREQRKAAAATAKHGHGHSRRGVARVGKGRRTGGGSSGGTRYAHVPPAFAAAVTVQAAAGAAAATGASWRPPSTTMLPTVLLGGSASGGGDGGCVGSAGSVAGGLGGAERGPGGGGGCGTGRKASRAVSATFAASILEMVRTSAAAGGPSRPRQRSPAGSPLTRLALSRHRSFTAATIAACAGGSAGLGAGPGARGEPAAAAIAPLLLLRSSANPNEARCCHKAGTAVPPLSPQLPEHRQLQQPQRPHPEQVPSQRTDFETWSVPQADLFRTSNISILQQAAACDPATAAGAAAVTSTAAAAPPPLPGAGCGPSGGGFMTSLFGRDSASSSQWFLASRSPSSHAPAAGCSNLLRSATHGAVGGGAAVSAVGGGDSSLILVTPGATQLGLGWQQPAVGMMAATAAVPAAPLLLQQQQPSAPVAITGAGAFAAGRGRGVPLVRAGSRLQFTSTPATQPSIPEDVQATGGEVPVDVSLYGGDTMNASTPPSDPGDPAAAAAVRLLTSFMAGEEPCGALPSIGASGADRPLRVAAASPQAALPSLLAAAAPLLSALAIDSSLSGAGTGYGTATHTGGRSRSVESACSLLLLQADGGTAVPHSPLRPVGHYPGPGEGGRGEQQAQRADSCSGGTSRMGLLAAALAASGMQGRGGTGHCPARGPVSSQSQSRGLTSPSGGGSGSGDRQAAAAAAPQHAPLPPRSPPAAAAAAPTGAAEGRIMLRMCGGGGGGSQSRTGSTALTHSTTTSSAKRLSSTAIFPPILAQLFTPGSGGGSGATPGTATLTGTAPVVSSGVELTPSIHGSAAAAAATASAVASGGGGSLHGCTGRTGSSSICGAGPSPPAATTAVFPGEGGDAARHEVLERGWRTLQQIMQRLSARPGDYLTRIVMEDADQGALQAALRSGVFGQEGGRLRSLLLTALDVARGMAFLHSHNVIHGDLKPSNVLLCSDPSDPRGFVAKVSDFGLSRIIGREHDYVQNGEAFPAGTVRYLAPEAVGGASFKASDVWSFAVVLWQLATGEVAPWPGLRSMQVVMGVMQGELRLRCPPSVYPPLAHLIESCLAHDHKARPAFDDIVERLQAMLRDVSRPESQPRLSARAEGAVATGTGTGTGGDCSNGSGSEPEPRSACAFPPGTDTYADTATAFQPVIGAAFLASPAVVLPISPSGAPVAPVTAAAAFAVAATSEPTTGLSGDIERLLLGDGDGGRDGDRRGSAAVAEQPTPPVLAPGPAPFDESVASTALEAAEAAVPAVRHQLYSAAAAAAAAVAASTVAAATAPGGGGHSHVPSHCGSFAGTGTGTTSLWLTTAAGASSIPLLKMPSNSSWGNNTTTTLTLTGVASTSTAAPTAHLPPGPGPGLMGLGRGSSSLLQQAGGGVAAGAGSGQRVTGSATGAGPMTLERHVVQELYSRPHALLAGLLPDDLYGCGTGRIAGAAGALAANLSPLPSPPPPPQQQQQQQQEQYALAAGGGGGPPRGVAGGAAAAAASGTATVVAALHRLLFLPPVHEEQPPTSGSGLQTVTTHGSVRLSGIAQLSAAAAAPAGSTASSPTSATGIGYCGGGDGSGVDGADGGGGGERALPGMF